MKRLLWLALVVPLMVFAAIAVKQPSNGVCVLPDGSQIIECEVLLGPNGEDPNVFLKWQRPTARENGELFPKESIEGTFIYYKNNATGQWNQHEVENGFYQNIFMYMPPAEYTIRKTVKDKSSPQLESRPTADIIALVTDSGGGVPPEIPPTTPPKAPTVSFSLPIGNKATITIVPVGGAK